MFRPVWCDHSCRHQRDGPERSRRSGRTGRQERPPRRRRPVRPLFARHAGTGKLRAYEANGTGGLKSGYELRGGFGDATALVQANVSEGGRGNDLYRRAAGTLYYTAERGSDTGGSADADLVGRDASGASGCTRGGPTACSRPGSGSAPAGAA